MYHSACISADMQKLEYFLMQECHASVACHLFFTYIGMYCNLYGCIVLYIHTYIWRYCVMGCEIIHHPHISYNDEK